MREHYYSLLVLLTSQESAYPINGSGETPVFIVGLSTSRNGGTSKILHSFLGITGKPLINLAEPCFLDG